MKNSLKHLMVLVAGTALVGFALQPATAGAQGGVTKESVEQSLEESYPVQVLKIVEGEIDGTAAWIVTVMNEGGDFNSAFQVTTLAVDRQTGDLIPSFRPGASGYQGSPGTALSPGSEIHPNQMQNGPWR